MPCYINLPLQWVYENNAWLDWFIAGRIAPELGLDPVSITLPDSWHKKIAGRLREANLACAVHLPFLGVDPCDLDRGKANSARNALRRGAELAALYGAKHMIGHPYYRPGKTGRENDTIHGRWMEQSLAAWPDLPGLGQARLFLENTYETEPEAVAALASALHTGKGPGVGACFDSGHWHSFAGHRLPEELDPWLDAFSPLALHLHLHDNDGSTDQHLGLGQGSIPFAALFERLAARGKAVTATLEPHDVRALSTSIAWLDREKNIAAAIGWENPAMDALPLNEIERAIAVKALS